MAARRDDESLAIDVLRDVGPGAGTFFGHTHTYEHFRDLWRPGLLPRQRYEEWVATGKQTTMDHTTARAKEILANHKPKPVPAAAQKKIDDIIAQAWERVPAVA